MGACLLVISNSAQILPAFAGGPIDTTGFVGMLSVSGCYGRLFFGGVSDALAATVNRPWSVVVACVIIGISHLVLCTGKHFLSTACQEKDDDRGKFGTKKDVKEQP